MNKFFHVLNIVFFTVWITIFIIGSPVVVRADDFPFKNPGSGSLRVSLQYDGKPEEELFSYSGFPYCITYFDYNGYSGNWFLLAFDLDRSPVVSPTYSVSQYTHEFNGVLHVVYYSLVSGGRSGDGTLVFDNSCTRVFDVNFFYPNTTRSIQKVCNYFLFGEGSLDYEMPSQDIEDADLDIKGLSAFILNDFQATPDYIETSKNAWKEFYLWSMNKLTGQFFDDSFVPIDLQDPISGTTKFFVPGVAMSWLSPTLDNDIIFNIWVDGVSDIKYKTSSNIIDSFFDTQRLDTVSYGKLKINDSSLFQNPGVYYQYNTAQAVDVILDYIKNNAVASSPVQIDAYNYISLDTKISRVYIQASKVVDGDNHIGALSYIDIVGGVPVVHEGITSIDDVPVSDPSSGTPAIVGSTSVVSGDTIYGGDTYFDNSTTNNFNTGLIVGNGDPLSALASVKKLFSAIFELVQSLYLTKLIKWILLGFTGNPKGDLIL